LPHIADALKLRQEVLQQALLTHDVVLALASDVQLVAAARAVLNFPELARAWWRAAASTLR
jgi:hypothetical protein